MDSSAPLDGKNHSELAARRLDRIRENLLNFSRRNPLVNTRLDAKTGRYLRVVDELPQVLYDNLTGGQPMAFTALPEIPDPPEDEQTERFQAALEAARSTDRLYESELREYRAADPRVRARRKHPERSLKDRVRESLGLPKRIDPLNPPASELHRHAEVNGIDPHFELPHPTRSHEDGRHDDLEIQTLALPEQMRRNLEKVHDDDRTAQQEAGINSLYCAFGFLEWTDPGKSGATCMSPLILLPVSLNLDRRRQRYTAAGTATVGEPNLVLAEKLRRELKIELDGEFTGDIEAYFAEVKAGVPSELDATVHRFVAFGTFNSTQVSVFNDLDPAHWPMEEGPALDLLISSAGAQISDGFAAEYPLDRPEYRKDAPLLVADADSSQVSTLIDMLKGQSFALEGPPGSGKSQTIVNAIAAALERGNKVLFVAQKTAALEVVRARLTERGLADFLLTLQAGRSERQSFREQVKSRMGLPRSGVPHGYDVRLEDYHRNRERLQRYLDALAIRFGRTGSTVHHLLSEAIATAEAFELAAADLPRPSFTAAADIDRDGIISVIEAAGAFQQAVTDADHESGWRGVTVGPLHRTAVDEHLRTAAKAAESYRTAVVHQHRLETLGFTAAYLATGDIRRIAGLAHRLAEFRPSIDPQLVAELVRSDCGRMLRALLDDCAEAAESQSALAELIREDPLPQLELTLRDGAAAAHRIGLHDFDPSTLQTERHRRADRLEAGRAAIEALDLLRPEAPWIDETACTDLAAAAALLADDHLPMLRLRNQANTAEGAWAQLQTAIDRVEALRAEREALTALFRLDSGIDPTTCHEAARTLETTGVIGKLGGTYRSAKKHYQRVAVVPKPFDSGDAAANLERLASWGDEVESLFRDQFAIALLGPSFAGLDTPLDAYRRLVAYLRAVDGRFADIRQRRLRALLLDGASDLLTTIARLDLDGYATTVAGLGAAVEHRRAQLAEMDHCSPVIEACALALVNAPAMSPSDVSGLADKVREQLARLERIGATPLAGLLGRRLQGAETDLDSFKGELEAIALCETDPVAAPILAQHLRDDTLESTADLLDAFVAAAAGGKDSLATLAAATGAATTAITSLPECGERAAQAAALAEDRTGLQGHSMVHHRTSRLHELGFGDVADWLRKRPDHCGRASALILAHLYRALAEAVFEAHGDRLRDYLGSELDDLRTRFSEADRELKAAAADMLGARLVTEARPPRGVDRGRKSDFTELGLLAHEMELKRSRNSVREVTRRAPHALLELKPCWMMSPLAVSQYLARDIRFDLCIIDEASQMLPGAAMGAVLRSKQVMIVGDNNQLPPTDMFTTASADDEDDDDFAEEAESVLEMAGKAFPNSRRLRWHYRSRNSNLIAFSNRMIYDDELVVFPSSWEAREGMGVKLEYLGHGVYHKSLNRIEAEAVVEAVAKFVRADPDRSLGVVAMNVQQRTLINDLLNELVAEDTKVREYVDRWENEREGIDALFVKNLENVQGDERDVIFISTVYGPDKDTGAVRQHFGPVNGKSGRRRLNVLFTRARQQLVTFTSMRPSDIKAEENGNPGRFMLRRWLEYCGAGGVNGTTASNERAGSRLAEHIGARLREHGFEVDFEVGSTGHRVNLAVRHPEADGGYLCGIDCDAEEYYTSASARDRDILRPRVLEGLGWRLYRVWSVNWFNDEEAELSRLLAWIEACRRTIVRQTPAPKEEPDLAVEPVPTPDPLPRSSSFRFPWQAENDSESKAPPEVALRARAGDTVALELPNGLVIRPRLVRDERAEDNHHRISIVNSPGIFVLDMAIGEERDVRMFGRPTRIKLLRIDRPTD
jgi:hypothetical protein